MILIKNAKIHTMTGQNLEPGDILIDGDKIQQVGPEIDAPNAQVIDATGLTAMPGIIDAHCHIGMWEDGMGEEGADGNECVDPISPELRAIDGINPFDRCFEEARENGITTVVTGPGSANVIGGQFVALNTVGDTIEDMIIKEPLALKIAFGENPKGVYSEQKKSPSTRMATAAMLRQALIDAQEYEKAILRAQEKEDENPPERDLQKEILVKALHREILVKAHAHRADDILTAIRIGKEFNLDLSIEHCTEGHLIAQQLKKEKVKIILGPLITERCKIELKNLTFEAPRKLYEQGIEFAIMTDHPVIPTQYLPVCAAICVRYGLPEEEALKAITLNAAKAVGLEDRLGSIQPGKQADIVLWAGDPLDARTKVEQVWIRGQQVK